MNSQLNFWALSRTEDPSDEKVYRQVQIKIIQNNIHSRFFPYENVFIFQGETCLCFITNIF